MCKQCCTYLNAAHITSACRRARQLATRVVWPLMRGVMRLENSKYRRMIRRLPDDAKTIFELLGEEDCFVESYSPQYM